MLKFLFWTLVLVNAVLFAYQRGYLGVWTSDRHEPARMAQQVNSGQIKPIPESAVATLPGAAASPSVANAAANTDTTANATLVAAKPETHACTEIGNFDAATAKRFETQLLSLALGNKVSRRDIQEVVRNIVYIPSLASKEAADKKAGELRHLGVSDFYIVQDAGEFHWSISLGVFKTEDAARARLAALTLRGVHSARLGIHAVTASKSVFQLRNLDAAAKAGLDKIALEFPHAETHGCEPVAVVTPATVVKPAASVTPAATADNQAARAVKGTLPR